MMVVPEAIRRLRTRYEAESQSDDLLTRLVATEQLRRLNKGARAARRATHPITSRVAAEPARWAFALETIITASGNPPQRWRRDGSYDCGHEPRHQSVSARCLWVQPSVGRWWCRSCLESGDALSWLMLECCCAFPVAYAELLSRFGPPFREERDP